MVGRAASPADVFSRRSATDGARCFAKLKLGRTAHETSLRSHFLFQCRSKGFNDLLGVAFQTIFFPGRFRRCVGHAQPQLVISYQET